MARETVLTERKEAACTLRLNRPKVLNAFNRAMIQELQGAFDRIRPDGESFDPNIHEAVSIVPTDELEPGQVVEVMQEGYRYRGRLVRAARVIVSAESEGAGL